MSLTMHTDWDDLLQQSESLATRNTQGFPRVERDISQIEAFSSRLRAKAQGVDSQQDDLAATRLLAQEGFNSRRLDRALQDVELKPTYEDLFQAEYSTVEEYLEQMHEMTVLSAIQDAQEESIAAFDRYMTQCIDQEWALNKRHLFESALADRGRSSALALPLNEPGNTLAAVTRPDSGLGMSESAQLSGREKGYTEVVQDLNKANLSRQKYDAVSAFAMVAAKDATDQHRSTIGRLWGLLSSLISEAPDHVSNGKTRQAAMLRGAQRYLEMGHVKHITIAIQSNRAQANLGGNPSKRSQIQAYLRMREKDAGPLDFDTPGGLDTTWHRIFFSLRSAYGQEALEVASKSREAPMVYGGTFARYLEEWISNDGSLSGESNAALVEECDRLRASADRATWQKASFRYKFAVHALLAGDKRCADSLLREGGSVFSTIEDFMWFMACLVRSASSISPTAGPSIRNSSGRVGDAYKLSDLQHYIVHFPPSHYSQNGKEPLLYATVLLLSLQFQAAITFLAKNATTSTYRVDAPHLAIALLHHQALDIGGEEDAGSKSGTEPGKLIHQYGLQFARNAYEIALEYFMLAAEALGNDKQTKARLLRELLTESNAFGFLLGSGSHGGALDRWMGNEQERQQLIEAVAYDCQRAAQLDWASELFLYANAPRPALNLLNLQISDLLEPGFQSDESELDKLLQRGADAANLLATSSAAADEVEKITFAQLKLVHQIFTAKAQANLTRAAQLLPDLNFLPLESFRLQRCTEAVPSLHRALLQRLPSLLLVGAEALAATGQVAQLRILVAFAGNLPQRISQGAFRELNDIYNRVS